MNVGNKVILWPLESNFDKSHYLKLLRPKKGKPE